ncbi:23S rRNA (guanine(745)-N(1))-methyltransferase [Shewanella insulae]|uniref:23S rRNA (Guanine(745)-N(1))-methyltransferase n=1 Tax=Shewanella insulae TaxID=2681496 RepID=A0A6L7HX30_9GAMM|nr:23S rRNA (guanine(745)-N(1))-methyltransferase [Shewanella insulae]MCG9711699.1 23S rRNA (guanine(745)-N(1))-methyltransferase [Shewanella insulae]MXR68570.1 23S rRNA (guanine(745)-N(1))-methyltransferase [Shewanella insulae]
MIYLCPICQRKLSLIDRTWCCEANHRFDCAKEGYVNLLPVQKKRSKDPGDNKEMMFARREFLNKGYYEAMSDRVNALAKEYASEAQHGLDIGCGEGYYTHRLQHTMGSAEAFSLSGLDISKSALKYAAKRYPDIQFCVASSFEMPFADQSFDFMLRIYAPSQDAELRRVAKPGAILITVSAGPQHHFALKQVIYDQPRPNPEVDSQIAGFERLHSERLTQTMTIDDGADIAHFLAMTPYNWKFTDAQREALISKSLTCELDFKLEVFRAC